MPLEDFLIPGENIRFSSPQPIEYQGDNYDFFVTDRRLLWYKRRGLVFKKDKVISENIGDIIEIKYDEKGIISKKGLIKVTTDRKKTRIWWIIKCYEIYLLRATISNV